MYRIWTQIFKDGEHVGSSVSCTAYVRKGNAVRVAKQMFDRRHGQITYKWWVSETNPWVKED